MSYRRLPPPPGCRTIEREALARLAFCNSKDLPRTVYDNGVCKEWVGIGWINAAQDRMDGKEVTIVDDGFVLTGTPPTAKECLAAITRHGDFWNAGGPESYLFELGAVAKELGCEASEVVSYLLAASGGVTP